MYEQPSETPKYEVEIKREETVDGENCFGCSELAKRCALIGRVDQTYGDRYYLCDSEDCEEAALDDMLDLLYGRQ